MFLKKNTSCLGVARFKSKILLGSQLKFRADGGGKSIKAHLAGQDSAINTKTPLSVCWTVMNVLRRGRVEKRRHINHRLKWVRFHDVVFKAFR